MSTRQKLFLGFLLIFLSSCMATPQIQLKSGNMAMEIKQKAPIVNNVDISPDGRYVLSGGSESFILWDILQGEKIQTFTHPGTIRFTTPVSFSPDGKYFASGGEKGIKLWDSTTRQEIMTFGINLAFSDSKTSNIPFSPDGKYFLSTVDPTNTGFLPQDNTVMKIFDVATGRKIRDLKLRSNVQNIIKSVVYSPDGKYVLSGSRHGKIVLWNTSAGKSIKSVAESESIIPYPPVNAVAFSPDGKYALSGGFDNILKLWDIPALTKVKTFKGHRGITGISSVAFSPDGKYALSAGWDNSIKIWDIASGTEWKALKGHTSMHGVSAKFSPNGKQVISAGDASTKIWDASTGEEVASMIAFEDGEWLTITSEGYYNASEKGAQYLSVKVGKTSYRVDSFYDVFYRPDIVTAKLRGEDIKDLITITMKDAIKSPPPVVEISPITSSPSPKAKVCYNVKSTGGGIGEVRLFHNGKLIESDGYYKEAAKSVTEKTQLAKLNSKTIYEDMRSIKIKEKTEIGPVTTKSKGKVFNDCKEINAISGENEISITAFNKDNTVQGYMQTAKFTSAIKPEEPHLYILSIGIDQYKDNSVNLKYAVKDSKDIEDKIVKQAGTLYKPQNIHYELLADNNATKGSIISKIVDLSKKIKPTDSFILFVAGHGVLLQNQYYMLAHDFDGSVGEDSLISSNEIVEMSKKIKSLNQLFIFDTCHAGGVDYIVSGLYDARMSVLAKKMGLHIYASASDKQSALDGYQGNGLFTYTLLDGLNNKKEADKNKDNKISLVELGEYSKTATTDISKKIGHAQTPLIINFGKDNLLYNLR